MQGESDVSQYGANLLQRRLRRLIALLSGGSLILASLALPYRKSTSFAV
jgi:hypothetical protein